MKRRDYLLSMEGNDIIYPDECYYGTLREAKKACRWLYKKEMKDGDRLIIRVGDENSKDYGKVVSEYYEKEGWIDFLEIVD